MVTPPSGQEARALFRLGFPIVITQLAQAGMGLTDTLMAGRYGSDDLAGVAIGGSIWMPLLLLFTGILMGTVPLVAQGFGAGKRSIIRDTLQQGCWLALGLGAIGILVLTQSSLLLDLLGVNVILSGIAEGYLLALVWAMPAATLFILLRCGQEAIHQTAIITLVSIAGLLVNIPLNYLLIYGALGFPELGGVGCGWATALSIWVQLVLLSVFTVRSPHFRGIRFWRNWHPPQPSAQRELLWIGVPIGVAIFFEASMFLLIALLLAPLGTIAIAGHQIAFSVISVTFMLPLSLSMALTIRVGYRLGLGDSVGAQQVATTGIMMGWIIALAAGLIISLFATSLAALYSSDAAVIALAAELLFFAAIMQASDVTQVSAAGALRGYKDTRYPLIGAVIAYGMIGLPVGYSLAMTDIWGPPMGPRGFWIGFICGLTPAAIALLARLYRTSQRTIKRTKPKLARTK